MPKTTKAPKELTITWRDENYGSTWGQVAFRCYDSAGLSDTARTKLQRAYRKAGFTYHDQRACWMAERSPTRGQDLVTALQALGYAVRHTGCQPAFVGIPA